MKILQVIPIFSFPELFGGSQTALYQISKALTKRGHEVTVYTSDLQNLHARVRSDIEEVDGIRIVHFKNVNTTFSRITGVVITPTMAVALRKGIQNFDVVHVHEVRSFQHVLVHKYSTRKGVPYIIQSHGILGTGANSVTQKPFRFAYNKLIISKVFRDATRVIILHDVEARQCANIGVCVDKIKIIPNGIDLSEFENLPPRGEFRRKYGLNDDQKVVLYLGRIHAEKGLDLLAKAFAQLAHSLSGARLVIVGPDHGFLPTLKRMIGHLGIEGQVLFTGPLYEKEKIRAYVDADVYVLPSFYEAFGLTALEACVCGTPIIVSDGCGIAKVIHGQVGLAVPYDQSLLSNAMSHILKDERAKQVFGKRGKSLVREQFTTDRIVEQVENVYKECSPSAR